MTDFGKYCYLMYNSGGVKPNDTQAFYFINFRATKIILLHPPTAFCQQIDIQHIDQVNLKFQF